MPNRRFFWLLAMVGMGIVSALALSACNTVRGAGEDVEASGEFIQEGAEATEEELEE